MFRVVVGLSGVASGGIFRLYSYVVGCCFYVCEFVRLVVLNRLS